MLGEGRCQAAHLCLQGHAQRSDCWSLGQSRQRLLSLHLGLAFPEPWTFPLAEERLPPCDARMERHRKRKVLGESRYLGHPKANPASISQVGKGPVRTPTFSSMRCLATSIC